MFSACPWQFMKLFLTMISERYAKKVGTKQRGVNYAFRDQVQNGTFSFGNRYKISKNRMSKHRGPIHIEPGLFFG
jgi:hypothetical protein